MRKIPVFRAIARGYGFGFGKFGTALAICWLPYVLIIAAAVLLLTHAVGSFIHGFMPLLPVEPGTLTDTQRDALAQQVMVIFAGFYRSIILFGLIYMLLRAMVAVGLTRASIGLEQAGFFYFSLGSQVWKLFGARLATYLILYAAQVVLAFIGVLLGLIICLPLLKVSIPAAIGVGALLIVAILCAVIYISVRLNFFLPPIIVSEKKLDILRSWNLSEGNVLRILGIYLAMVPPLIALVLATSAMWLITFFVFVPNALSPSDSFLNSGDWLILADAARATLPWIPPLLAVAFLLHVLLAAILYAATARAYRGVVATDIASQTPD